MGSHDVVTAAISALPRLMTSTEVALVTRRSCRTVRRWIGAGLLPTVRPGGGRLLVEREALQRFLEQSAVP
jgi:excisionase family DNA binding protein